MPGRRWSVVLVLAGAFLCAETADGQPESPNGKAVSSQVDSGSPSGVESPSASPADGASGQSSPPAQADPAVRERAKQLYEQGVQAFRDGRYSDAIDKLLEADHVMPNAAFSYNIALVYEKMEDERSALRWLRNYLRQSKKGTSEEAPTLAKMRKLEAALQAQGLQQVSILSQPSGATIQVDGHAVGITPFTTEITPGIHRISLSLEGHEPVQRDFELRPDRSLDVMLELVAKQPKPTPEATNANPPRAVANEPLAVPTVRVQPLQPLPVPTEAASSSRIRPFTWIGLGAGALLLGGSALFELERRRQQDVAERASQADYPSSYDAMETRKTISRVLLATGSAVLATGATLLVIDLTRTKRGSAAALGGCGNSGICAHLWGQF